MNQVTLMGRLTADPEVRKLPSGASVGNFTLASNERYKDKDGNVVENTSFIPCEVFGSQADTMARFFKKGRNILLSGTLKQHKWQDKNSGENKQRLSVRVDNWYFVDSNNNNNSSDKTTEDNSKVEMQNVPF